MTQKAKTWTATAMLTLALLGTIVIPAVVFAASINNRVSVIETNQARDKEWRDGIDKKLDRMDGKLDRALEVTK